MKRPLVLVGFCYLLTLAAAAFFGPHGSLFAFWFCLAGFAVTLFWKRTRRAVVFPVALAAAATALGAFCLYSRVAVEPPRTLDGLNKTAEGTICELPVRRYGRWYYVVRVDSMDGEDSFRPFKIRLSTQNAISGAGPYSRIRGKIHLFLPTGGDGDSSRSYYASKGVMMFAYLYEHQKTEVFPPPSKPPYYYALRFRQKLLESIRDMLPPDEAGLVGGILLGDKTGLSEELISDFRIDGISHLLSVSGLHMATIAQLMIFLLLFFRVPKKPASAVAACGVFGFMAVTCFVPSVTRSGIMCLLFLAAPILSRRADPLNSLCAAVLAICLPNPYAAADVGLLLSFFATLGLILCAGPLAGRLNAVFDRIPVLSPLIQAVSGILSTSAAAALFTLPVILLNFGSVSLVAPLSNLLELVPSTLLMGSGAIAALLNLLSRHAVCACRRSFGQIYAYLRRMAGGFSRCQSERVAWVCSPLAGRDDFLVCRGVCPCKGIPPVSSCGLLFCHSPFGGGPVVSDFSAGNHTGGGFGCRFGCFRCPDTGRACGRRGVRKL